MVIAQPHGVMLLPPTVTERCCQEVKPGGRSGPLIVSPLPHSIDVITVEADDVVHLQTARRVENAIDPPDE
jgi:hypothetical protein